MQQVIVANPAGEPVHAHLEGNARVELVESADRRWSINVAPAAPQPVNTGSFQLRFNRPAVLDMICGCDLPAEGFLAIQTPAAGTLNLAPGITAVTASYPSTSFYGGVYIRIPILNGIVHPTLLSVPVPLDQFGHMDLMVLVQQKNSPEPHVNYYVSLTGHFVD